MLDRLIADWEIKATRDYDMDITRTLYVTNRDDWRNWLEEHYRNEKEIWLVYYRKQAGKAAHSIQ